MTFRVERQGLTGKSLRSFELLTGISYIGTRHKHTLFLYLLFWVVTIDITAADLKQWLCNVQSRVAGVLKGPVKPFVK